MYSSGLESMQPIVARKLFLECPIAGLAYHDISDVWDELYVGAELALVREKHNKHDKNAVAVALAGDFDGDPDDFDFDFILGYVPKEHNTALATLLDMGWNETLRAEITALKGKPTDHNAVKMTIYIVNKAIASSTDVFQAPLFVHSIEEEEWQMLHQQLWDNGFAYFRWRTCFPQQEQFPLVKRHAKVVFYRRGSQQTLLLLMNVVAVGDDCSFFLKDPEELHRIDDCGAYILTAIEETFLLDEAEDFALKQLTCLYNHPYEVTDPQRKEQILRCFRIFRQHIKP